MKPVCYWFSLTVLSFVNTPIPHCGVFVGLDCELSTSQCCLSYFDITVEVCLRSQRHHIIIWWTVSWLIISINHCYLINKYMLNIFLILYKHKGTTYLQLNLSWGHSSSGGHTELRLLSFLQWFLSKTGFFLIHIQRTIPPRHWVEIISRYQRNPAPHLKNKQILACPCHCDKCCW